MASRRSGDIEWSQVPARIVAALRGICPFNLKQVLGYKESYVSNSAMNSVILAKPALALGSGPFDLGGVERGAKVLDLVEIIGAYPIHSSEREFAYSHGFDALWSLAWDRFDPTRAPVVMS